MFVNASALLFALTAAASVSAHGVLVAINGDNGVKAQGFGVVESTPRDGTRRNPFQTDSSIIRDREIANGDADACGRTLAGGVNNMAEMMEGESTASSAGLPSAAADGSVSMVLHQVNGDGAGPYTCDVSADASGKNFVAMKVTTNVPGRNSRSNAKAEDFPLVAQMPANTQCTGGPNGDACVVRCRNAARAGPFGGCAAVTNAEPKAAPAAPANKRNDVSLEEADAALAEDLERRDDVSLEEAEAALAEDLEKRSFNKKRYLRTRVAGAKAGYWI